MTLGTCYGAFTKDACLESLQVEQSTFVELPVEGTCYEAYTLFEVKLSHQIKKLRL